MAAAGEAGAPESAPAAVFSANRVAAANAAARAEGVRRGMRRRDAQARCPELVVLAASLDRDVRAFEPVLAEVEALRPGVAPLRPGLLAVRAPQRFYGGEENAAALIAERLAALGLRDIRLGLADDLFTAEHAARLAGRQEWRIVDEGGSAAFLADLSVEALATDGHPEAADLVGVLRRLGLDRLGDYAALPAGDVHTRFGSYGARVHRLVRGVGPALPSGRTPPPDLVHEVSFEPPLASVEAVCFSVRRTAEEFVSALADRGLVCTAVEVAAEGDDSRRTLLSTRLWVHPHCFTAADLVDRVHWQLQAGPDGVTVGAPVGLVRFSPETVEDSGDHADGLWGGDTDDRVVRGVARVQALLGYDAVVRAVRQGGRSPADRQALVPWGERPAGLRSTDQPWPGALPAPAPSRVFAEPWATAVVDDSGTSIRLTGRGSLTGEPARIHSGGTSGWRRVATWAGPWPAEGAWWEVSASSTSGDGSTSGRVARLQVVDADGHAWLLRCTGDQWWTEAGYE